MSDATTAVRPSLRDPRNWPMFAAMLGAFAIARLPWMLQVVACCWCPAIS